MIECWQAGELRAYLDRELPAADMARLRAHLQVCGACAELSAHLEQRAGWVASRMDTLSAPATVLVGARPHPKWGVRATIALAAALVLVLVLLPRRAEKPVVFATPPRAAASPSAPAAQPPAAVRPAVTRRILPRKKPAPRAKPQLEYFLALDDEPVETGMVVRVGLDNGRVPADLIVGADGRAHAIRLVSSVTGGK